MTGTPPHATKFGYPSSPRHSDASIEQVDQCSRKALLETAPVGPYGDVQRATTGGKGPRRLPFGQSFGVTLIMACTPRSASHSKMSGIASSMPSSRSTFGHRPLCRDTRRPYRARRNASMTGESRTVRGKLGARPRHSGTADSWPIICCARHVPDSRPDDHGQRRESVHRARHLR